MYVAHDRPGRYEALVLCWPTFCSAGSALCRRWVDVYLVLCGDDDGGYCLVDTMLWPSLDLVPGRRRRRWTGIESALGLFLSFAG